MSACNVSESFLLCRCFVHWDGGWKDRQNRGREHSCISNTWQATMW